MAKTLATKSSKMRPQLTEKERSMGSYPGPMTLGWEDVVAETLITRGSCKKPPKIDMCTTQKVAQHKSCLCQIALSQFKTTLIAVNLEFHIFKSGLVLQTFIEGSTFHSQHLPWLLIMYL